MPIVHRLVIYAPPERVFEVLASADGIASVTWACSSERIENIESCGVRSQDARPDVRVIH